MSRVLALELRRSGARVLVLGLVVAGFWMFGGRLPRFSGYNSWASGWGAVAGHLSEATIVLGPISATVAAWVGAREKRWAMRDLLATTPRPAWRRSVVTLSALGSAAVLGFVVFCLLFATAVFRASSWFGGDWPLVLLLSALGMIVCVAWGWTAGRLVPRRLTAPVVGIVLYLGCGIAAYGVGWGDYVPIAQAQYGGASRFMPGVVPLFALWLVAIAASVVVPAVARRRVWVLVPVVVAVAAATSLHRIDNPAPYWPAWVEEDPVAVQQVCTEDAPVVCVTRAHRAFLPAVTPLARDLMRQMSPVVTFTRAEEQTRALVAEGVLQIPDLGTAGEPLSADLADPSALAPDVLWANVGLQCGDAAYPDDVSEDLVWHLPAVAALLLLPGDPDATARALGGTAPEDLARARGIPDPAAWTAEYLAAARSCDLPTLRQLAQS